MTVKNSKDTARGCGCLLVLLLLLIVAATECSGDDEYASPDPPGVGQITPPPVEDLTPSPTVKPKLPKLTCKNVDREYDKAMFASDQWAEDFRNKRLDKALAKLNKCAPEPEANDDDVRDPSDNDSEDDSDEGDDDGDVPGWLCPTRFC